MVNCSPEDVGEEAGYDEFLEIIKNQSHPDYAHTKSWRDSKGFGSFDLELVNRRLKYF